MSLLSDIHDQAKANTRTIVLPEGHDIRILSAASKVTHMGMAKVVVLSENNIATELAISENIDLSNIECIDTLTSQSLNQYAELLYEVRQHKGLTKEQALELVQQSW